MILQGEPLHIFFSDSIHSNEHPEILKLQNFLKKEKTISDPRIYYAKIKNALKGKYYVGYRGAHIHIKSLICFMLPIISIHL